jgi:hypothetical protein
VRLAGFDYCSIAAWMWARGLIPPVASFSPRQAYSNDIWHQESSLTRIPHPALTPDKHDAISHAAPPTSAATTDPTIILPITTT